MREILFRAILKYDTSRYKRGQWCFGDLVRLQDGNDGKPHIYGYGEVFPKTIGQFTGLTDKNGKKIFEGDIVHCISRMDSANMVVIFEQGEFRMVLADKDKDYIEGCRFYAIGCFTKEVIGNIHDNPELLERSVNDE